MKRRENFYLLLASHMQAAAAILGITIDATAKQAKKAYREKALACHPDHHPDCEAQFQKLSEAYETFTRPGLVSLLPTPLSPFHFDTHSTFA